MKVLAENIDFVHVLVIFQWACLVRGLVVMTSHKGKTQCTHEQSVPLLSASTETHTAKGTRGGPRLKFHSYFHCNAVQ
jgi:hypothetical protein